MALLLELLGFYFYVAPLGPDIVFGSGHVLGLFLLFFFFVLSLFSWGLIAARIVSIYELITALLLGTVIMAISAFLLLSVGAMNSENKFVAMVLLNLGPGIYSYLQYKKPLSLVSPEYNLGIIPFLILMTFCFPLALYPNAFPDPLIYHLVGPRKWLEAGSILFGAEDPGIFYASYWDFLYVWSHLLLGGKNDGGLVAAQIFSQLLHWGLGGILLYGALLKFAAFLNVSKANQSWVAAFCLYSMSYIPSLSLGKNDWGISAWLLWGCLFCLNPLGRNSKYLGFFLIGLAVGAKFSYGLFALPFAIYFLWQEPKRIFPLALTLMGIAPILVRNYCATKNPFYPILDSVFPTPLWGPTWSNISAYEGQGLKLAKLALRIKDLFVDNYLNWGLILLPFLWIKEKRIRVVFLLVASGYLFFCLKSGFKAEPRLFGPGLLLVTLISLSSVLNKVKSTWSAIALFLVIVLTCNFPWKSFELYYGMESYAHAIRNFNSGNALAWLRLNVVPEDKILSVSESRLYYQIPSKIRRLWDDKDLDLALNQIDDPVRTITLISSFDYKYVLITNALFDSYNSPKVWELINQLSKQYPESLVFSSDTARILSVPRLIGLIQKVR